MSFDRSSQRPCEMSAERSSRALGVHAWRSALTAIACLAVSIGWTGDLTGSDQEPQVVLRRASEPTSRDRFELLGISATTLDFYRANASRLARDWIVVVNENGRESQVPLFGEYRVESDRIVFEPRFSLQPGLIYTSVFKDERTDFEMPKRRRRPSSEVLQVYPTKEILPENQLKFYVHFSQPMSRGMAYRNVRLIKREEDGRDVEIAHPFLELGEELWDPSGTRFTLFFDPGRIKRGLQPREIFGPALETGCRYQLIVNSSWEDAQGTRLKDSYTKAFQVVDPDYRQPTTKTWRVSAPNAGSRDVLSVSFDESMDHAMLHRVIEVQASDGSTVGGTIAVKERETRWEFSPVRPWSEGRYRLVVDTTLEDLAGNSLAKPFEVDIFRTVKKKITTEHETIDFHVR